MAHGVLFGANLGVRSLAGIALALLAAAHGQAAGQAGGEIPAAGSVQRVAPIRRELVRDVRYRPDVKQGVEQRPQHPPFDQLQTMMPLTSGMMREVSAGESLTIFDPATGG
ncbi:MAG: hypothetical protein NTV94_02000, partial [Planctomycetota bacterium]|nr:hypothetical protein [Planctomycetota bacterium]